MTLAEFLDARLAEDEEQAEYMHMIPQCMAYGRDGFEQEYCDCGWPARVLREVEAKRAIIGMVMSPAQLDVERDYVLAHFAAIYEDHPDFDPQWKA